MDKTYDTKEVAEILKQTLRNTQNIIHRGELKASRVGKAFVVTETDLQEYLEFRKTTKERFKMIMTKADGTKVEKVYKKAGDLIQAIVFNCQAQRQGDTLIKGFEAYMYGRLVYENGKPYNEN